MPTRQARRLRAYNYILDHLRRVESDASTQSGSDSAGQILLDDLLNLKNGTADPSPELIANLRILLSDIVSSTEFEEHLVKPFSKK